MRSLKMFQLSSDGCHSTVNLKSSRKMLFCFEIAEGKNDTDIIYR